MELQERADKLAAMERECATCCNARLAMRQSSRNEVVPCDACQSTGRVPLFAGVRDECDGVHTRETGERFQGIPIVTELYCAEAGGRGWTTSLSLERWLEAAQKAGYRGDIIIGKNGYRVVLCLVGTPDGDVETYADTPLEALFGALEQAQHLERLVPWRSA